MLWGTPRGELDAKTWLDAHGRDCKLAVIDLFLKDGSGFGVVSACKTTSLSLTLVLLTNYATPEMRRQAQALGADAMFDKSSELDEFFAFCSQLDD